MRLQTVDGVTLNVGDRILVRSQTKPGAERRLYAGFHRSVHRRAHLGSRYRPGQHR
jgi:hypothetical protein